MSKEVKVQFSVSYDIIRQMFCVVSGKVLTDEKIDELVGSEVLFIDTKNLEVARKDTEEMLGAVILAHVLEVESKPKSRFEQRLEELKKQKENEQN